MDQQQHVLIIGFVWPEPSSSAAGSRMMQLISLFREQGWEITFASAATESKHAVDLAKLGIEQIKIEVNDSDFDELIQELQPSIVMFDRFVTEEQFGWRVAEHCPDAIRILDTEDLHCLRRARKQALQDGRKFTNQDLFSSEDAKREIASIHRSDLSLIISEAEVELLTNTFDVDPELIQYLPFLLDPIDEKTKKNWPDFSSRIHFVTIGNFQHDPNMDAVVYLKQEVWPRILDQLPESELHIYGSYLSQKAEQLHNPVENFFICGRAEDAKEVIRESRVLLAPLRFGAGLKGKLVEAMQCGTPSITTEVGAEGIAGNLPWPGKITNDPATLASAAVKLFSDQGVWHNAQENGVCIINQRFARDDFTTNLINQINELTNNLDQHRLRNFIGQMLMHHTMDSSRYMSRWIEEKNR